MGEKVHLNWGIENKPCCIGWSLGIVVGYELVGGLNPLDVCRI